MKVGGSFCYARGNIQHLSSTPIEKTLMQTLACQHSCNSCSRLTGTCELRKLSCKLSLLNSHQLLFSFDRDMRVEKTLMQTLACQHSCNSCSRLTGTCKLRKLSCRLSLADSHQLSLSFDQDLPSKRIPTLFHVSSEDSSSGSSYES
jgi:hypothetical protein